MCILGAIEVRSTVFASVKLFIAEIKIVSLGELLTITSGDD